MNYKLPDSIPAGWTVTSFSEVASHRSGNSKLIKGRLLAETNAGLFPAFSATGQDVWRDGYDEEGDAIIISAVGARCGKCFLASGKWSAIANTHVVWPKPEVIDRKFLWYRINDEGFWIRSGSAQPFVAVRKSFERPFALPPLFVQKRIVAEIEKQFSRLDEAVANLKRVKANLKRYKSSVLKAAVEGKLTEDWREQHPNVEPATKLLERILAERRMKWSGKGKYEEPSAPETTDLPSLPKGWMWATVEQLSMLVQYGSSVKTHAEAKGVPVLRMGNIEKGRLLLDSLKYLPKNHDEFPELFLREGDILFNRTNSAELVGKTAVYKGKPNPCSFASYLIRVRLVQGYAPDLLAYFINSAFGRAWIAQVVSQQVGQANVNGTKLQALSVPIAPLGEQEQIVAEVERRLSVIQELEATVEANLTRADRLRQSVLRSAFSGGLVDRNKTTANSDRQIVSTDSATMSPF